MGGRILGYVRVSSTDSLTPAARACILRSVPKYADPLAQVDLVFKALADPTRRQVIERLASGGASTSALAAAFAMALPSFTGHLAVLEAASLVTSTKRGRTRTYELAPPGLDAAQGWLAGQRQTWQQRLDQLDRFLTDRQGPS